MISPHAVKTATYASVFFFAFYILVFSLGSSWILRDNSHSSIVPYIERSNGKPFIYRALVPETARLFSAITPESMQQAVVETVAAAATADLFKQMIESAGWKNFSGTALDIKYIFPISVIALLMYAGIATYGITLYRLAGSFFPGAQAVAAGTTLLGLTALLPFVQARFQIYDPWTLAFSALCLLFMYEKRWRAYLICFTIACLNRETIILQTMLFAAVYFAVMEREQFRKLLAAQIGIYAVVMASLKLIYIASPDWYSQDAWRVLLFTLRDFSRVDMLVIAALCAVVCARWRELPLFLRQSLWILAGCVAIYYLCGRYREYRVFFDAFPSLSLIAGYTLFSALEKKKA